MSNYKVIKGEVSRVHDMQTVSGSVHNGRGRIKTKHKTTFSIGSQAADINGTAGQYLIDGDMLVAVGEHANNGVFHVAGFKNETSGVLQEGSFINKFLLGAFCVLFGLLTSVLIIPPIIFIPLGLLCIWTGVLQKRANEILAKST